MKLPCDAFRYDVAWFLRVNDRSNSNYRALIIGNVQFNVQETKDVIAKEYITDGGHFLGSTWTSVLDIKHCSEQCPQTGQSPLYWEDVNGDMLLMYAAGANITHLLQHISHVTHDQEGPYRCTTTTTFEEPVNMATMNGGFPYSYVYFE